MTLPWLNLKVLHLYLRQSEHLGYDPANNIQITTTTTIRGRLPVTMDASKDRTGFKISRLCCVQGHMSKANDIVVCRSLDTSQEKRHVIYFGGDVQDFKENMSIYNPEYASWDLETVARILHTRLPGSTVFVVRPSEMLLNTFSIFRNFLSFDEDGRPEFSNNFGALIHLAQLYENAVRTVENEVRTAENKVRSVENEVDTVQKSEKASSLSDSTDQCVAHDGDNVPLTCVGLNCSQSVSTEPSLVEKVPISLVGFSKGCVVLNQLMFELGGLKENTDVAEFLSRLEAIYWIDGGHIGRKDAYITDYDVLQNIVNLGVRLLVHVTPYQIMDSNRPWIDIEEREFVQRLKRFGADVQEYKHFMNFKPSIKYHFKVLTQI
ncbi:mitochondrial protein C2orf69 homolog [Dreissena polymorpha]|uniref:Uncharacterized protein n=1 Tax=Dreissena polymorpha TaxID=45954 RepID=A0A9D4NH97_DREPO|nr:mitochondrial protein C2orf69 homolog [Dreissena polymorpha]XP_052258693.1 mitochondrial protein C2orf69 homolog [Dreissena polymorpha]KAH3894611.1 hypothetical protein DPMN_018768 [Dreissena polymorpha]KAH3894696.1 hypothetical protein DPMN_018853 [Dreissena polymorpha]